MDQDRRGIGISRLTHWILAAVTVALTCEPGLAQELRRPERGPRERLGASSGLAALMRPDYLGRDLAVLDEHLQFDDSQRWIVETNLADYETDFQMKVEIVRDQMRTARGLSGSQQQGAAVERRRRDSEMHQIHREIEELRKSTPAESQARLEELSQKLEQLRAAEPPRPSAPGPEQIEALTEVIGSWIPEREALSAAFIESVRSILDKDQLDRWPAAERALRRQKLLGAGRFSGESVNLFFLVRELPGQVAEQDDIKAILEDYAIAIDAALVAREAHVNASQESQITAMLGRDADRAVALAQQEASLRTAVRDVNEKYLESLAGALTASAPDVAADLRKRYHAAAFPRIHRYTRIQAEFDAALAIGDLDPAIAASIATLRESLRVELAAQNANLEQLTRAQEPGFLAESLRRRADRGRAAAPRDQGDPIRAAMAARTELEERYRAQLEALLTPEQLSQLPAESLARDGGFPERRPGTPPGMRRQMRERFDTNGDGTLDDQEVQKAMESMRNREGGAAPGSAPPAKDGG